MKPGKAAPNGATAAIGAVTAHPEVSMDGRAIMRDNAIAARTALSPAQHKEHSQAIEARLAALLARCSPRVLGFYWPFRAEFDCRPLVSHMLAERAGLRAGLPVVGPNDAPLRFRAWQPDSIMATDRYGISFPASGVDLMPDTLLIPLNAFDAQGYRLGYGAGYFDRTLAAMVPPPLTIGVGFELGRVASIMPEPHDVPLDAIVTEAGVEIFSIRLSRTKK